MKQVLKESWTRLVRIWRLILQARLPQAYFPKYSILVVISLLILLSLFYGFQNILFLRPQGLHQWRQCDCLSLTMNYYQDSNRFFEPAMHNLGEDGTGKTANDFPILYYTIAQIWKLFGPHEFIYRLMNILIMFAGLALLMKMTEHFLKDSYWAIIMVLFLFTSPTLVYYTNNFLTNITAFGLVLVAWYFFYSHYQNNSTRSYILFFVFFALAGLLKISSLLSLLALLALIILHHLIHLVKKEGSTPVFRRTNLIGFILVLAMVSSWYIYARFYNGRHNDGYFLIGILPIWDADWNHITRIFNAIKDHLKHAYFHPVMSWSLVFMWFFNILFYKRTNPFLLGLTILTTLGMISFGLLFYQALEQHDYYMINQMILVPLIIIAFLDLLKQRFPYLYHALMIRLLFVVLLIFCMAFTRTHINYRYSPDGWENENRTLYTYGLETIEPYLDSIGVGKEIKVICGTDHSINISLYLMNRKGWTGFNLHDDSLMIASKIEEGARIMMAYEKKGTDLKWMTPFININDKVGQYQNISIFTLGMPDLKQGP